MRMIKKWQLLTLLLVNAITFNACSSTPAENNQANTKNDVQQPTENLQQQPVNTGNSPVQAELDKAKKAGKAVFVVVTGNDAAKTDEAISIAEGAKKIYTNAVIVEMNRDNPDNAQLVKEWRLSGAPLPLILVVSSNGMLSGGQVLNRATAENIASMVPSPKLEQIYAAIANKKNAIVAFTKKSFSDREEVLKECNEAISTLGNEAVLIEVDMNNKKETAFMKQLRINPETAKASVTLVINKQGQVAGTSTTIPDAEKLVAAAKTPVKSGCGPGCGPAGCGQ
ncbi:MAG: hypothetical protein U5Q03_10580 [Bacteroidota bacterium]|nr:hypothetical protein [Bacteroidota bacterium]